MANVLVVGNGGREHALAWKLRQSPEVAKVFTAPTNATEFSCNGISNLDDVEAIKIFCIYNKIDLIVLGPEKPICQGWTEKLGLTTKVFGPSGAASVIESSKWFSKNFMKRHEIPTANFETFDNSDSAKSFIERSKSSRFVIKEDGLRAGKGVFILDSVEEAKSKIGTLQISSESPVIVEEFLDGFEISALCFTDGTNVEMMPFSQDHKRAFDGDKGENTGGMGAVAPIYLPKKLEAEIKVILQKTVDCLKAENLEYKGVLYAGLMITKDGPKVLEYNSRFGDPEAQVLMRLLDSDLYLICRACCDGNLSKVAVHWTNKAVIGVVLASKGYPGTFETGKIISVIPEDDENVVTFFAGIQKSASNELVNSGGRVLCVTSTGKSFYEARTRAYKTIGQIRFDLAFFRNDIGHFVLGKKKEFSYKSAGVDIAEGNELVAKIKDVCQKTRVPGTDEIGGFGALVDLKVAGFQDPILVLGMDGVGTKIEIATKTGKYDSLGFDLVGMCANDVVCHGAAPVAFLDYYVTGKLNKDQAAQVITSIAEACQDCSCALVGGETAEMPGVYGPNQWDLAGCCVGVRERSWGAFPKLNEIKEGDVIIGLYSSGLHSNGFSLVRAILAKNGIDLNDPCPWDKNLTFGDELLKPTKIYVNKIMPLVKRSMIKAVAHITGGGLIENVPRILPAHLAAKINCRSWQMPEIFSFLQELGQLEPREMFRTFNCGIGMAIVVDNSTAGEVFQKLATVEAIARIGNIQKRKTGEEQVVLVDSDSVINHKKENLRSERANVAIFISGTGTNAINLIEQAANPRSRCNIRVVISNNPDVKGLEAARERGIEAICVPHGTDRTIFEQKLHFELVTRDVDFICLAGFMRILTPYLLEKWPNKIINIHPSLLPAFKGAQPVRDALAAGVKVTGCTAHFVTEEVDAGRILAQEVVFVDENDTEATLHAKIQQKEYLIFPKVMENVAQQILDLNHS